MSAHVEPIVKWVGGKRQLLDELIRRQPESFVDYCEPFAGGASLCLALPPLRNMVLSDANFNLISTYSWVARDCSAVESHLQAFCDEYHDGDMDHMELMYYRVRDEFRAGVENWESSPQQAARFIFLNKTCYNGLYRESDKSGFNASFGKYANPLIVPPNLRDFSCAMGKVKLRCADFREVIQGLKCGDFLYCDCPYDGTYTQYTANRFSQADQEELARECKVLDRRGVYIMLSNSDTSFIRDLYRDFRIEPILAPRSVSRDGDGRSKIQELIIRNY